MQNLGTRAPESESAPLAESPGDSDACSSFRNNGLKGTRALKGIVLNCNHVLGSQEALKSTDAWIPCPEILTYLQP